jgi:hypothetical protein
MVIELLHSGIYLRTVRIRMSVNKIQKLEHLHPGTELMQEMNLSQLESTQSQVLISLGNSDRTASQRISSCRYHARCHSTYCPRCLQSAGYARKDKLLAAVSRESGRKWKLITLTAANIWPEAVREAAQAMTRAGRATLKRLKIADYSQTFEASYTDWTEDAHPHVHVVAELPRGGRRHVSPADLEESYLDALPAGYIRPARPSPSTRPDPPKPSPTT